MSVILLFAIILLGVHCKDCKDIVGDGEYNYCGALGALIDCDDFSSEQQEAIEENVCCPIGTQCVCDFDASDTNIEDAFLCEIQSGAKAGFIVMVVVGSIGTICCLPCLLVFIILSVVCLPFSPVCIILCCPAWVWLGALVAGSVFLSRDGKDPEFDDGDSIN